MRFTNNKLVVFCIALVSVMSCGAYKSYQPQVLFQASVADSIPYRIPTIATLHNGNILALADYRICGSDIGYGRVDIRGRISRNGGRSWGKEFVIIEGSGVSKATDCGFGDAAMVVDRESGEVLVVMVCGETVYGHETTTRQNPNRIAVLRSHDNGKTWSQWEEITENVYSLFDNGEFAPVHSCFVASGKIMQSRQIKVGSHYRIYAALCARPNGNIAIYYEENENRNCKGGYDMIYKELSLETITDGRYSRNR